LLSWCLLLIYFGLSRKEEEKWQTKLNLRPHPVTPFAHARVPRSYKLFGFFNERVPIYCSIFAGH
jgi:hypothetical protein